MNHQADSYRKDGVRHPMNGIEKIIERITADSQAEIDQILREAQQEADAISARYAAQAEQEKADLLERGKKNAAERSERLVSVAQIEAKKMLLNAKQEMLDKAFALAAEQLKKLSDMDYLSLLASLAVASSSSGKEEIVLSPEDREKFGSALLRDANGLLEKQGRTAALTLSSDVLPTGGGLLLSDGKIETNCTFETLLRLNRSEIAGEVAAVLFQ